MNNDQQPTPKSSSDEISKPTEIPIISPSSSNPILKTSVLNTAHNTTPACLLNCAKWYIDVFINDKPFFKFVFSYFISDL